MKDLHAAMKVKCQHPSRVLIRGGFPALVLQPSEIRPKGAPAELTAAIHWNDDSGAKAHGVSQSALSPDAGDAVDLPAPTGILQGAYWSTA